MERYSWANLTLGWSLHRQWKFYQAKLSYERAMPYYITVDNKERQSMLLRLISYTYSERGYNETAFEYILKAIRITFVIHDARGVISSPQNMANIYKYAGDKETALRYFSLAAQNAKPINPVRYYRLLGDICMLSIQEDSAKYYYNKSDNLVNLITTDTSIRKRIASYQYVGIGEFYLRQKNMPLLLKILNIAGSFLKMGMTKQL
jgi:tetratricopeptide (TPR) repeat protein